MWRPNASLLVAMTVSLSVACTQHGVVHIAPDESQPHISWEIRSGTHEGDEAFVCGSATPATECVIIASTAERSNSATVHLFLHAAAKETRYLGIMRVGFLEGNAPALAEVNTIVPARSSPVTRTETGIVAQQPGNYVASIALDAVQEGHPVSRITQDIKVVVRATTGQP